MNKNLLYRRIPKVDVLLEDEKIRELTEQYSYDTVLEAVREELDKLRALIGTCEDEAEGIREIEQLSVRIQEAVKAMHTPNMRTVINGTGTICIQTLDVHRLGSVI